MTTFRICFPSHDSHYILTDKQVKALFKLPIKKRINYISANGEYFSDVSFEVSRDLSARDWQEIQKEWEGDQP